MRNFLLLVAVSFLIFLSGCGRSGFVDEKDVIAYVNKEPITASELKRGIALKARQDRTFKVNSQTEREQLELIINKKLIIQGAMAKGLAREDRFVNTIKTFWEQTLIRDFLDFKKREFEDFLFVTEEEAKKYYDKLSQKLTFKVLKSSEKRRIEDAYNAFLKNKDTEVAGWETVGPLDYDDIDSQVLLEAFELPIGSAKIFTEEPNYYVVTVTARDAVSLAPFGTAKREIEKRVLAAKERKLFDDWMRDARKKARVRIIKR